ncbi:hypothetical protein CONPUDRAFT_143754 [Coniophora puteana RWD-64-598 SS2]|uniref:RING-type domain-containing protein n=1 Tax=Coniophora puteana (strain RWD-64-598) TaxID=741705 RepID=A0A5M3MU87_CONPW|nr:uncharacterized protein CONPUDRAFT_143754 [Coniophora puteana RWD-64-598 SS2]EIW82334.1 hypothetical protein CONPUDRAFT_143754 [Coniophora puteana RWD-64-598 SS2]
MPTTRSQGSRKRRRPDTPEDSRDGNVSTDSSDSKDAAREIQGHLDNASAGIRRLLNPLRDLRKKNIDLEEEVVRLREAGETGQAGRRSTASSAEIRRLKDQVNELEKAHKKDKRKIQKLEAKEAKADADELLREAEDDQTISDTGPHMRKLLRKFSKLMGMNVLDGDAESCPVCFEKLEVKRCYSLPCNHVVCMVCFRQIGRADPSDRDAELVKCPECRHEGAREDCDIIIYKAEEHWDQLLALAAEWARIDNTGATETSEEEEDGFVDDGTDGAIDERSTLISHNSSNNDISDDDRPLEQQTPEPEEHNSSTSYQAMDTPTKRALLAGLAARKRKT